MSAKDCIEKLTADGYCYVRGAYDQATVAQALDKVRAWYEHTVAEQSDRMPFLNRNQPMVYNLQNKDLFFFRLLTDNPLAQEILSHFLNDEWFSQIPRDEPNFILRSLLARSSNTRMPLHIDSFVPSSGRYAAMMQCAVMLEDASAANGCTLLVPGSHLADRYASQDDLKDAIPLEARAGDLLFWDSRVWHGAGENGTDGTRWAIIGTFGRWWIKQAFDIPGNLPQSIYAELTDSEKAIMGFCSVPYGDEREGIDMKRGYDLLPERLDR